MPSSKRWSVEVEEFRGFGRSEFWPFRGRLRSLTVGDDLVDVRPSLRDERRTIISPDEARQFCRRLQAA